MDEIAMIMRSAHFAAHAHRHQRGKGAAADVPYVNHLAEVASLLADADAPATTIAAGWLHDTIEDTDVTYDDLVAAFGLVVADQVRECTDDKALPWQERKTLQAEHAALKGPGAQMIKLADKTSNLRRMLATPPGWDQARCAEYAAWSARVVAGCRGVNPALEAVFDAEHARVVAALAGAEA